eukprot:14695426-Heterocapsa_arctica.AAC.1
MAFVLAIEMCQVVLHEFAALHFRVEGIHEHLIGELDLHARNNLAPEVKERRDGLVAVPLELSNQRSRRRSPYSGSSG